MDEHTPVPLPGSGLPNTWIGIAIHYGFPGLVAIILLGALLGFFTSPLTKSIVLLEANAKALEEHRDESQAMREAWLRGLFYQQQLMRAICNNTAKSHDERRDCNFVQPVPPSR